jgi:hypothetical protein
MARKHSIHLDPAQKTTFYQARLEQEKKKSRQIQLIYVLLSRKKTYT